MTDKGPLSLHSTFQKKLEALEPRRRVGFLTPGEFDAAGADSIIVWLAAQSPPETLLADSARTVLVCLVNGAYDTFDSIPRTYAQMGRGYACAMAVARLREATKLRNGLERRIKVLRHAGPGQAHEAAATAALMIHQWLVRFARSADDLAAGLPSMPPAHTGRANGTWHLAMRLALAARAFLGRLCYGIFFAQRWRIGHLEDPSIEGLTGRLGEITWWPELARGEFLADPFIESQDPPVILCEWKRPQKGRGVIARVRYQREQRSLDIVEILDGAYAHLSYPNFVEYDGAKFLFPECAQSGRLTKYRLDESGVPRLPGELLFDQPLIDATLLKHDGRWWLFGTMPGAAQSESHLYLFHSLDLDGSWTPHPLNPVVIDPACARPAGRIMVKDGRLIRPAQDCERRYGNGLAFMEITLLTTDRYEEQLLTRLVPPARGFPRHGIHTFNIVESPAGSMAILDGYTVQFDPLAWFDRLMERPRFRKALGKGSSGHP
ncbi:MAG TPA: hypothetical protein VM146_10050 [Steroidobacteraceae bacterium]|nr:hypothetical protein [Steroidobacteraceae bacterium]